MSCSTPNDIKSKRAILNKCAYHNPDGLDFWDGLVLSFKRINMSTLILSSNWTMYVSTAFKIEV